METTIDLTPFFAERDALRAEIERLRDLVLTLIDNDPYEPIADNGMTVLDGWRERARKELGIPF